MIVKLEQDLSVKEIEVLIKYAKKTKDIDRLYNLVKLADARIKCNLDSSEKLVYASAIYYFESVDKMTFVYCENNIYRTESRLYQLVEDLSHFGFVQINKSCVLNINVLDSIKPLINSRMEATLKNGERLYITRKYLSNIKEALQREESF
jgi:DNA-binding LytR/AlgR family response regulator